MKVGDRIVCVYAPPSGLELPLKKGRIYILFGVATCSACGSMWFDVGLKPLGDFQGCGMCSSDSRFPSHTTWASCKLFRPLEYNSAHEELLNKEVVEEKSDVPVKEPQKQVS